jgi:hypothetical protein
MMCRPGACKVASLTGRYKVCQIEARLIAGQDLLRMICDGREHEGGNMSWGSLLSLWADGRDRRRCAIPVQGRCLAGSEWSNPRIQ